MKKSLDSLCAHGAFEGVFAELFFFETELPFGKKFLRLEVSIARVKNDIRGEIENAF